MPFQMLMDASDSFTGRVQDTPEFRYENGGAVATFTLITQAALPGSLAGHLCRVICFGRRAEFVSRYLSPGQQAFVAGDAGGTQGASKRSSGVIEIVASSVIPLGRLPLDRKLWGRLDERRAA